MTIRARSGWLAALLLAGMPGPAHADDCRTAATQTDLGRCAGDDLARADAALNSAYRSIMDRLHDQSETAKLLVTAQKMWLGFRDAECEFEASSSLGGSVHPMIVAQCKAQLTRARIQGLNHLLSCGEGDLACPLPPR